MAKAEAARTYRKPLIIAAGALGTLLLGACGGSEESPPRIVSSSSATAPQTERMPQSSESTAAQPQTRPDTSKPIKVNVCDPSDPSGFEGPARNNVGSGGSFEVLFCQEVQAESGVNVFDDYKNASGIKARLEKGSTVAARCVQVGPEEAAPSAATDPSRPGAIWYEIGLPREFEGDYVAANVFWNVRDHSIPFEQQPVSDPRVTDCK